jgi:hypothetical protein
MRKGRQGKEKPRKEGEKVNEKPRINEEKALKGETRR